MMHKTQILSFVSIAYTAILLCYSALPFVGTGAECAYPSGNIVHFFAYAIYSAVLFATFSRTAPRKKPIIISLFVAIAVGAATELIQLYVPGRACDVTDWLVDALGAAVGLGIILLLRRLRSGAPVISSTANHRGHTRSHRQKCFY